MKTALFTMGYEGRGLDEHLGVLAKAKIDRLIDIRALPLTSSERSALPPCASSPTAAASASSSSA